MSSTNLTQGQSIKGESIDQYVTALKLMTRNCAFGALEEELIRDRIVSGVFSEKIKERLLKGAGPHLRQSYRSMSGRRAIKKTAEMYHRGSICRFVIGAKSSSKASINSLVAHCQMRTQVLPSRSQHNMRALTVDIVDINTRETSTLLLASAVIIATNLTILPDTAKKYQH